MRAWRRASCGFAKHGAAVWVDGGGKGTGRKGVWKGCSMLFLWRMGRADDQRGEKKQRRAAWGRGRACRGGDAQLTRCFSI